MKHGDPIAWQDIEGSVSLFFCQSDWETVRTLVLETAMSPLSRCNAGRASFTLREDFEALLNATREEPDYRSIERELLTQAKTVLEDYKMGDELIEERDLIEARVTEWALEELGLPAV
jgi:hypothetical protein